LSLKVVVDKKSARFVAGLEFFDPSKVLLDVVVTMKDTVTDEVSLLCFCALSATDEGISLEFTTSIISMLSIRSDNESASASSIKYKSVALFIIISALGKPETVRNTSRVTTEMGDDEDGEDVGDFVAEGIKRIEGLGVESLLGLNVGF